MRTAALLLVALTVCACDDDPLDAERKLWNSTYREPRTFPPSQFLAEVVKGEKPGRALDIGMGQGRNALLLASQGWQVTGIDISEEGIQQAREAAAARQLSLETILHDVSTWDHGTERWDLVLLIYSGDDAEKVRRSLKRGGLLVSERFHRDTNARIGTTPEELAARYGKGYEILRNEVVEEVSVWGGPRSELSKVVHFAARKP